MSAQGYYHNLRYAVMSDVTPYKLQSTMSQQQRSLWLEACTPEYISALHGRGLDHRVRSIRGARTGHPCGRRICRASECRRGLPVVTSESCSFIYSVSQSGTWSSVKLVSVPENPPLGLYDTVPAQLTLQTGRQTATFVHCTY